MKKEYEDFFFMIPRHSNPSFRDKVFEAVYSGKGREYHVYYKQEDGTEKIEKIISATAELSSGFWEKVKPNTHATRLKMRIF